MRVIFLFLLIGIVSLNTSAVSLKDKFVFKLAGEVFTINELFEYYQQGRNFGCVYRDALIVRVFEKVFKGDNTQYFGPRKKFNSKQIAFLTKFMSFSKLLIYSRSYEVEIERGLLKYFKLLASKNSCGSSLYLEGKDFHPKFLKIVRLEIFLRNRFLPIEAYRKVSEKEMMRALESAKGLLSSVDDQVSQEVYW